MRGKKTRRRPPHPALVGPVNALRRAGSKNLPHESWIAEQIVHTPIDDQAICVTIAIGMTGACSIKIKMRTDAFSDRVFYRFGV